MLMLSIPVRHCRAFSISRWPFRTILSIDKMAETIKSGGDDVLKVLEGCVQGAQTDPEAMLRELESCRHEIYLDPSFELPADVKRLRQAMSKNEFKLRMKMDSRALALALSSAAHRVAPE